MTTPTVTKVLDRPIEDGVTRLYDGRLKTCVRCRTALPRSEENFVAHWSVDRQGRRVVHLLKKCRKCVNDDKNEAHRKSADQINASRRAVSTFERRWRSNLKKRGLTPEQYEAVCESQRGLCAICEQPETRRHQSGRVAKLSVDHDHGTGRFRGLLCSSCNVALGHFRDAPALLRAALAYLERQGKK